LGDVGGIALGVGFGVLLRAGGEAKTAADHLWQPDVGGGVGDAAPCRTFDHREQQRQRAPFSWEPAVDFTEQRVSPNVRPL
jgi:hypothetical protein